MVSVDQGPGSGPLAERGLTVSSCFRKRSQFDLVYFVFTRKQQTHNNQMRENKCFCINEEMERIAHTCPDSKKDRTHQEHCTSPTALPARGQLVAWMAESALSPGELSGLRLLTVETLFPKERFWRNETEITYEYVNISHVGEGYFLRK